jgi:pyrroloquinoline quinone (PQQ) biosynthesis protein C
MLTQTLQLEIEACAARLHAHPLLAAAKRGAVPPETVAKYLSSVLYLVRHTPPHLVLARKSAEQLGERELARFFQHKLGEEHGHDRWAESDLREMGTHFGASVGATREPCRAILALVRDLERAIRVAPASYLAYILFAEYITVLMGPVWVGALREHCGVPAEALSVVSRHADLDREHVAECVAEFDDLLATSDAPRALETLRVAMAHFEAFCDELHALARTSDAA